MTWLYIPSTSSADAPAPGDSTEAFTWRCQILASSVTSSGKPMPLPTLRKKWRQGGWMTRLFGMILPPSTAARGAESWMRLCAESRANHIPSPASSLARTMNAIYGPTLIASLARLTHHGCSWKTSPVQQDIFGNESSPDLSEWASGLRLDSSWRWKWARPIKGSGFSCLGCGMWHTPNTPNGGRALDLDGILNKGATDKGKRQVGLEAEVKVWPQPKATDWKDGRKSDNRGGEQLPEVAKQWPTCNTPSGGPNTESTDKHTGGMDLEGAASTWPSARAEDSERTGAHRGSPDTLTAATGLWPTCASRDWKGPNSEDHLDVSTGSKHLDQLPNYVQHLWPNSLSSPQDPPTMPPGSAYSELIRILCRLYRVDSEEEFRKAPKRLNPAFVEWLMGWEAGTTQTGSDSPETEWSNCKRHTHLSCLLQRFLEKG